MVWVAIIIAYLTALLAATVFNFI